MGFKIKNLLKKYMRKSHSINIALRENGSIVFLRMGQFKSREYLKHSILDVKDP